MEKIKIKKEIFWKTSNEPFCWRDIKDIKFEDDDIINIGYEEPYDVNEGYFIASVERFEYETDEQFLKRKKSIESEEVRKRELRYKTFLKLKEEFDNGGNTEK
jgi:hypothetical protein